jgi:acetoin utilization deacetylase AcuC-like enzyme
MAGTAIVYSPRCLNHKPSRGHPESPRRLQAIMTAIQGSGLLKNENVSLVKPRLASVSELELIHKPGYIRHIKQVSENGGGMLEEETETFASAGSYDAARLASGGALRAVELVMSGEFRNAFCLVRPPGHHAGPSNAFGFCLFNNVALAAEHLIRNHGLDRVVVLDIDSHHGNGTQKIFYGTNKVLYVSLHEDPFEFPKAGFAVETGKGKGRGYTVNIPLPYGTGDPNYWEAFKTIVKPIIIQYSPKFFLISIGFDGYYRDPVGNLSLSAYIFPKIFQEALELADDMCKSRLVAVLEGGYSIRFLRKIVPTVISQMAGMNAIIRDKRPSLSPDVEKEAARSLKTVRHIQSSFWLL